MLLIHISTMKIVCTQENLKNGISLVSRIVNQSLNLPILGNLLLEAGNGVLTAQATNLEQAIKTEIRCKIEDPGKLCVPARLFSELINSFPSQNITLELVKGELVISSGKFKSKLKTLSTEEFPVLPELEDSFKLQIPSKDFARALSQVIFATSNSESQPEITGVLLKLSQGKLVVVATDRFRLAEKTLHVEGANQELALIVPRRTAEEFLRISQSQHSVLTVYFGDNQIAIKNNDTEVVSRVIEGQFPDYEPVIPTNFDLKVSFSREKIISALKTVSVFCGSSNTIKISIVDGNKEIVIRSLNTEFGDGEVGVDAEIDGESMEVMFNYRYVSDMCATQDVGELEMLLISPVMPTIFKPYGSEDFRYLVMPIKS